MVLPDHWREPVCITELVGQFPSRKLHVVHQVVDPLKAAFVSEGNTTKDVEEMNPGVDVVAVFGNLLA